MADARDDDILHQADTEAVINKEIDEDKVEHVAIDDLDPASAAYVEAEANEVRDALNDVLAILRSNGLLAPSA